MSADQSLVTDPIVDGESTMTCDGTTPTFVESDIMLTLDPSVTAGNGGKGRNSFKFFSNVFSKNVPKVFFDEF